jgi:tripartite-type tricarboxylate transporter receptor subunit TctC
MLTLTLTLTLTLMLGLLPGLAAAQAYPAQPVKLIVSSAAGSAPDAVARLVAAAMAEELKQAVIVDNRVGANGVIGVDAAARAGADGYTLLVAPLGTMSANPHLYAKLPQNPLAAFTGITRLAAGYFFLAVRSDLEPKTLPQFVQYAKARPGRLNGAIPAPGSIPHLTMELLRRSAGIEFNTVPYKSTTGASLAVASGEADFIIETLATLRPHVQAGRVRLLAISTAARSEVAPEVPTFAEGGVAGMEVAGWIGLFAPAGTPRERVVLLQAAAGRALQRPQVRQSLAAQALPVDGLAGDAFNLQWKADAERWGRVVRDAGIRLE